MLRNLPIEGSTSSVGGREGERDIIIEGGREGGREGEERGTLYTRLKGEGEYTIYIVYSNTLTQ